MRRKKRTSTVEELLDLIFDLAGMFWQFGAVISGVLVFAAIAAYDWVDEKYINVLSSPHLGQLAQDYRWVFYLIPIMIIGIAIMLGLKSYESYCREHI